MQPLRTPDSRFENLPDFDFALNYLTLDDLTGGTLRGCHLDEGPREAAPVLCLHGRADMEHGSCLYRHMIPVCAQAGYSVIAPDLVGSGGPTGQLN